MTAEDSIAVIVVFVMICAWITFVVLGIKAAKDKNRSAHWMWFGIHPLGAFVVFIVMMAVKAVKVCPDCGERVKDFARLCPYCGHVFTPGDDATRSKVLGV